MFRRLRLSLTALYFFGALALIVLVGAGTYRLVDGYLQSTTDLALQHKMVEELRALGATVPPDLAEADHQWSVGYADRVASPQNVTGISQTPTHGATPETGEGEESGEGGKEGIGDEDASTDPGEEFEGELAAVFVLPLDAQGALVAKSAAGPVSPNAEAFSAALQQGHDIRTVTSATGTRVRLLTYPVVKASNSTPFALQLGRLLSDQDRVLDKLLLGLLTLGGVSALLLSAASWWLAGRALRPTQQAWDRQQVFVANASHELRTPLTLMRATTEVAMRGLPPSDTETRALLADAIAESDHMAHLVEDLLLLSRLDAGRLELDLKPVNVEELLSDVQRQASRLALERGVTIHAGSTQGTVRADQTRLRQVLLILVDNALHHTPKGGSIILEAQPHGKVVQIGVTDTGSGIAPEHLPHIFERFYRAGGENSGSGSGLGLSIARALTEAQHGHISVRSEQGQGTTVTLTLPSAN